MKNVGIKHYMNNIRNGEVKKMSRFDKYFLMDVSDVAEYVEEKLHFFPEGADLECREIGDGNLNYVFRLVDKNTKKWY